MNKAPLSVYQEDMIHRTFIAVPYLILIQILLLILES